MLPGGLAQLRSGLAQVGHALQTTEGSSLPEWGIRLLQELNLLDQFIDQVRQRDEQLVGTLNSVMALPESLKDIGRTFSGMIPTPQTPKKCEICGRRVIHSQ